MGRPSNGTDPAAGPFLGRRGFLAAAAGLLLGLSAFRRAVGSLIEEDGRAATGSTFPLYVAREEPLPAERSLAAAARTLAPREALRFNLLGLHWQGSGEVWFRTRGDGDRWSAWQRAVSHELPDPGSEENRRPGWRLGTPVWTGESTGVQYRLAGPVAGLRAHFVWSPPAAVRRLALAPTPSIVSREAWGADEAIVRGDARYAERLVLAVVHHTAGASPSSPEESAAIVRAIQAYHVKGNGWDDIGYNFLADGFGQVFEGRRGGIDRNVVGAHAFGFNTGSVGVALLGNYAGKTPTEQARRALADLLAWRLDVAHVDPRSLVGFSSGNPRALRAISGHRDVNATECPGHGLYEEIDGLAAEAALLGLPKLYEPTVEGASSGLARFTARLSEPRDWSVTVTDWSGAPVARGTGTGVTVDWTWDARDAGPGRYAYAVEAGEDVLPAAGSLQLGAEAPTAEPPPRPARPGSVPRRIPQWAWELRAWHATAPASRGPRPAGAPRRLPHWYWEWVRWLAAVERWRRDGPAG